MILVTGGAGFIGSNFILNWLSTSNEPIVNLDKLTYAGNLRNLSSIERLQRYHFICGDIADTELVVKLLNNFQPRAIVNFAAESHVDRSILNPELFVRTNALGIVKLLESVRSYWASLTAKEQFDFRFLQISTDEVYGNHDGMHPPFTELDARNPTNPYSASKASGDHLVRSFLNTYKLPVQTVHCCNNYGPRHFPEKLIPMTILNAVDGQDIPIYGDGLQMRSWLYVVDTCNAIKRVLGAGAIGCVYNIGTAEEKSNLDVVIEICKHLDEIHPKKTGGSYRAQIKHVTDRSGHDRSYLMCSRKAQVELDWKPLETFSTGIRKTIEWYLREDH